MTLLSCTAEHDPDRSDRPALALRIDFRNYVLEVPMHRHRKGQLVLALQGAVTCTAANGLWVVPPRCGVWIPGGQLHSNRATPNALLSYLFVEPDAAALPEQCCTIAVSAMVREMIHRLAAAPQDYAPEDQTGRLVRVLLDELALMPQEQLNLPVSDHPKIRLIADALAANPGDRSTLGEWAARVAMSERSLTRLMLAETKLSFGRWRQQFHLIVAMRELAAGASVQRVAAELGYESVTAFITMFRKALGRTPSRYFARSGPG